MNAKMDDINTNENILYDESVVINVFDGVDSLPIGLKLSKGSRERLLGQRAILASNASIEKFKFESLSNRRGVNCCSDLSIKSINGDVLACAEDGNLYWVNNQIASKICTTFKVEGISALSNDALMLGKPFCIVPKLVSANGGAMHICAIPYQDELQSDLQLMCCPESDEDQISRVWFIAEKVTHDEPFIVDDGEGQRRLDAEILLEFIVRDEIMKFDLRRSESGRIVFADVMLSEQENLIDLKDGDELVEVEDTKITSESFDRDTWQNFFHSVILLTRPLHLKIRRKHFQQDNHTDRIATNSIATDSIATNSIATNSIAFSSNDSDGVDGENSSSNDESREHTLAFERQEACRIISQCTFGMPGYENEKTKILRDLANGSITLVKRKICKLVHHGKLWNSLTTMEFILLSNVLLVLTIPSTDTEKLTVSLILPLLVIKLKRLPPRSTSVSARFVSLHSAVMEYPFEIISPQGVFTVVTGSQIEANSWIEAIASCVIEGVGRGERVLLGGVHTVIIGTLHSAAVLGNTAEAEGLLKSLSPECVNELDDKGMTPLGYAVRGGHTKVLALLLNNGANPVTETGFGESSALHFAAMKLNAANLRLLLNSMKQKIGNVIKFVSKTDSDGKMPLHVACVSCISIQDTTKLKECVDALISAGADIDAEIKNQGMTALHVAAGQGCYWVAEILLEYNANVNVRTKDEQLSMPLHLLFQNLIPESSDLTVNTLTLLLQWGGSVNSKNSKCRTPLWELLCNEMIPENIKKICAVKLLQHGARPAGKSEAELIKLMGKNELIQEEIQKFKALSNVETTYFVLSSIQSCTAVNLKDSEDESMCGICASIFTLFWRPHHCRACNIVCCGNCSTKTFTVIELLERQRACDNCYNRLRSGFTTQIAKHQRLANPQKMLKQGDRSELFGPNRSAGKIEEGSLRTVVKSEKLKGTLGEIGVNLSKRGQKLDNLADKSDALVDSASEFERMARELNRQQDAKWWNAF